MPRGHKKNKEKIKKNKKIKKFLLVNFFLCFIKKVKPNFSAMMLMRRPFFKSAKSKKG
jgi:hypothetical protein